MAACGPIVESTTYASASHPERLCQIARAKPHQMTSPTCIPRGKAAVDFDLLGQTTGRMAGL